MYPLNQSLGESQSVDSTKIKTGSGIVINIRTSGHETKALKYNLKLSGGDLGKSGPGPKAKADARRNSTSTAKGSGSLIIPGVDGFVPNKSYYGSNKQFSYKSVKVVGNPLQGDENNGNNPPPEDGQCDARQETNSEYKNGPSPFKDYNYKDRETVAQNILFNKPRRLDKTYDKHAKECFDITENRNNSNLLRFQKDIEDLAQSADRVYKGSYRYEDPAFIFVKEIDNKMTVVIVNATNNEYITVFNPTANQMKNLNLDVNIGFDTRPSSPSTQMILRFRGPKNQN
jgi:Colicin D